MADNGANPEFDPKHRILGAVILVTLAVILLPMILREESPPKGKSAVREVALPVPGATAPAATATATASAGVPLVPPPEPDPAAGPKPVAPLAPPVAVVTPPLPVAPAPAKPLAQSPAPATPEPPAPKPAAVKKGWVIQVGAFSRATNAEQLRDRLRKAGYGAEIEHITVDQGALVRVLVGPYGDRAQAKGALERLQGEQQLKGVLIAWPTQAARKP